MYASLSNFNHFSQGTFGQQAQQLTLCEKVVRVRKELLGGSGSILNAGFPAEGDDDHTVCFSEGDEQEEPEDSEWTKEIWLRGIGRSPWGEFALRGRVRAWDGLIVMTKSYTVRLASPCLRYLTKR